MRPSPPILQCLRSICRLSRFLPHIIHNQGIFLVRLLPNWCSRDKSLLSSTHIFRWSVMMRAPTKRKGEARVLSLSELRIQHSWKQGHVARIIPREGPVGHFAPKHNRNVDPKWHVQWLNSSTAEETKKNDCSSSDLKHHRAEHLHAVVYTHFSVHSSWESSAENIEFLKLFNRCRCASPGRSCRTTLCGVLSTLWLTMTFCVLRLRTIVKVSLDGLRAFPVGPC